MMLVTSLQKYMLKYDVTLYGYVIMDNHFHILVSASSGEHLKRFVQHALRESSLKITTELETYAGIRPNSNLEFNPPPHHVERAITYLKVLAHHANGKSKYAVWKERARGIPLKDNRAFEVKLNYIHDNPVRAGMVKAADDYLFFSYRPINLEEDGLMLVKRPDWY